MSQSLTIGLVYDLRENYVPTTEQPKDFYAEFDSQKTVSELSKMIAELGYNVIEIGDVHSLARHIYVEKTNLDLVFNIAEGLYGRARESQVPALLEANEIPHTGSDALTLALTLDKAVTKRIWLSEGLPTVPFLVVDDANNLQPDDVGLPSFPLFSKPLYAGSSIGIDNDALSTTYQELYERIKKLTTRYKQPVLVEAFLPGKEYTVCVFENQGEVTVLGITEILSYTPNKFSVFEEKEAWNPDFFAEVSDLRLYNRLSELAVKAFKSVGCRDIGRVDIRFDEADSPNLIEINPLPILKKPSTIAWIAEKQGYDLMYIIRKIINNAIYRNS
ncbi:MAG: D-alanine--D-alanine ligase [Deinococcota bacterium]